MSCTCRRPFVPHTLILYGFRSSAFRVAPALLAHSSGPPVGVRGPEVGLSHHYFAAAIAFTALAVSGLPPIAH
jgi:hypothetical protein